LAASADVITIVRLDVAGAGRKQYADRYTELTCADMVIEMIV